MDSVLPPSDSMSPGIKPQPAKKCPSLWRLEIHDGDLGMTVLSQLLPLVTILSVRNEVKNLLPFLIYP